MVQKLISKLSVLLVLLTFVAACSDKTAYTDVIPADAAMVISIDLQSLALKAGLNDPVQEAMKQRLMSALKDGTTASTFEQLEKVINNPLQSGIDLLSPIYGFTDPSLSYTALVARVKSQDDLHSLLETLVKEQNFQPIVEKEGYNHIKSEGLLLIFNQTALVVATSLTNQTDEELEGEIAKLLHQDASKSINSNLGFEQMREQQGDIRFLLQAEVLAKALSMSSDELKTITGGDSKELNILGNLRFDKGRIALQARYHTTNEATAKTLKENEKLFVELDKKLLNYFPASTPLLMSVGINGKELANKLIDQPLLKEELERPESFDELKEMVSAFQGDLSFGLLNIVNGDPTWVVYAEVNQDDLLKRLVANMSLFGLTEKTLIKQGNERYMIDSEDQKSYLGVQNKLFYFTNDATLASQIGKNANPSIQSSKCISNIDKKKAFMTLNFKSLLKDNSSLVYYYLMGNAAESLIPLFSHLETSIDLNGTSEIALVFENQEDNTLKQLLSLGKLYLGL